MVLTQKMQAALLTPADVEMNGEPNKFLPRTRQRPRDLSVIFHLWLLFVFSPITVFLYLLHRPTERFVRDYVVPDDASRWPKRLKRYFSLATFIATAIAVGIALLNIFLVDAERFRASNLTYLELWGPIFCIIFTTLSNSTRYEDLGRQLKKEGKNLAALDHLERLKNVPEKDKVDILFWVQEIRRAAKDVTMSHQSRRVFEQIRGLPSVFLHLVALSNMNINVSTDFFKTVLRQTTTDSKNNFPGYLQQMKKRGQNVQHSTVQVPASWIAMQTIHQRNSFVFWITFLLFALVFTLIAVFPAIVRHIAAAPPLYFSDGRVLFVQISYLGFMFFIVFYIGVHLANAIDKISDEGMLVGLVGTMVQAFCLQARQDILRIKVGAEMEEIDENENDDDVATLMADTLLPPADLNSLPGVESFLMLYSCCDHIRKGIQCGSSYSVIVSVILSGLIILGAVVVTFVKNPDALANLLRPSLDNIPLVSFLYFGLATVALAVGIVLVFALVSALQNSKILTLKEQLLEASNLIEQKALSAENPMENSTENPVRIQRENPEELRRAALAIWRMSQSVDTNPVSLFGISLTFATVSALVSLLFSAILALYRYISPSL